MSLLDQIKAAQLTARKQRNTEAAASLTTLIGEASVIGKNDGDRQTTDTEVIAVIKKFIKNIDEVIRVAGDYRDGDRADQAWAEKTLLEQFLPHQLTETQLRDIMIWFMQQNGITTSKGMGLLMRHLKETYDGQYDGATAAKISKELLQ